jgi:amidohydrolase
VRSLHPETYEALPSWIEQIIANVCNTYGAKYEMNYQRGVPSVQNDHHFMSLVEAAVVETWGREAVQLLHEPSLGAEDFAVYLNHAPGAMFRLGVGFPNRLNYPLHHPLFEPDEQSIVTGVVTMAAAAMKYWQHG